MSTKTFALSDIDQGQAPTPPKTFSLSDVDMSGAPPSEAHPELAAPQGQLAHAWNWLNKGLIDKETFVRAISGMPSDELNKELSEFSGESPIHAAVREFTRGTIQDTANTASSFTSPLAVGTMAVGGAGKIPGAVGKIAKVATGTASAGFAVKGASDVTNAVTDDSQPFPERVQQGLQGAAMAAGGAAGALESGVPQATASLAKRGAQATAEVASHPVQAFRTVKASVGGAKANPDAAMNEGFGGSDLSQDTTQHIRGTARAMGFNEKDFSAGNPQATANAKQVVDTASRVLSSQYDSLLQPLKDVPGDSLDLNDRLRAKMARSFQNADPQLAERIKSDQTTYGDQDKIRGELNRLYKDAVYSSPEQSALKDFGTKLRDNIYEGIARWNHLPADSIDQMKAIQGDLLESKDVIDKQAEKWRREDLQAQGSGMMRRASGAVLGPVADFFASPLKRAMNMKGSIGVSPNREMLQKAFEGTSASNPFVLFPKRPPSAGELPEPAKQLAETNIAGDDSGSIPFTPPSSEVSGAPGTPVSPQQASNLILPQRAQGSGVPMPASSAENALQVLRARSQVIRDPRTGRMRKQFVTSGVQP